MTPLPRLMLVTDRRVTAGRDLIDAVSKAVEGGAGLIQVREKDLDDAALTDLVEGILSAVPPETLVIVNSRIEVARATGCGLHLPAAEAAPERAELRIVGRSVHDLDESRLALDERVDYAIVGPVYPTPSKPGHPGGGTALVHSIASETRGLPLFAIGGVEPRRVPELLEAGAHGVAVCRAILAAADPRRAARELREATGG